MSNSTIVDVIVINIPVDSDGDGPFDDDEITIYVTDSTKPDTDGDGYSDGAEVAVAGADPLNILIHPDSDYDGDGYTPNQGDSVDTDPNLNPGVIEKCE